MGGEEDGEEEAVRSQEEVAEEEHTATRLLQENEDLTAEALSATLRLLLVISMTQALLRSIQKKVPASSPAL